MATTSNSLLLISFSAVIGLIWGSFLNVVAVRFITGRSLTGRSSCTHCHRQLCWWELIPVVSWLILCGRCYGCRQSISLLYPLVECAMAFWVAAMVLLMPVRFWPMSFIFGSGLLVSMRTDLEHFLILTIVSLGLMPLGLGAAFFNLIPLALYDSIIGLAVGFGFFALIRALFFYLRGVEGLGWGDVELLGSIGAFTGPFGVWMTVMIASLLGLVYGVVRMLTQGSYNHALRIPFALFLGIGGAAAYLIDKQLLLYWLVC